MAWASALSKNFSDPFKTASASELQEAPRAYDPVTFSRSGSPRSTRVLRYSTEISELMGLSLATTSVSIFLSSLLNSNLASCLIMSYLRCSADVENPSSDDWASADIQKKGPEMEYLVVREIVVY